MSRKFTISSVVKNSNTTVYLKTKIFIYKQVSLVRSNNFIKLHNNKRGGILGGYLNDCKRGFFKQTAPIFWHKFI